ncbi:MAG TPA: hypothetical protein VEA69_20410 [Tepidisphaeraceae bacterium]|nr:hypothetical protein [Tepidisphaeraceae bacterium]
MKQTLTISWDHLFPAADESRFADHRDVPIALVIPDPLVSPASAARYARLAESIERALREPLALVSRPAHTGDPHLVQLLTHRGAAVTLVVSNAPAATYRSRRVSAVMETPAVPPSRRAAREELICRTIVRHAQFDPDRRAFVLPPPSTSPESAMSRSHPHWPRFDFLRPENWGFEVDSSAKAKRKTGHGAGEQIRGDASGEARTLCPGVFGSGSPQWVPAGVVSSPSLPPKPFTHSPIARPRHRDCFDALATTTPDAGRGDPAGCLLRLRQARVEADHTIRPGETGAAGACFRAALALGRARLFGAEVPPADDFTLRPAAAAAAATVLYRLVRRATDVARELPRQMRRAGAYGRRDVALELLELRTDAWAAYLAIDEALAAETYEPTEDPAQGTTVTGPAAGRRDVLGKRVGMLVRATENLDANLQKRIALLKPAAGTRLIENWRRLLAPAYRELLPWWLDGRLESANEMEA